MRTRKKTSGKGTILDLWRPPQNAGDPVGCIGSTYTFAPGLFDEQCLARFLEIESESNREDLAFLLERENRLGSVYAGVLVDHTQAGVEHSLRWDVLPVRIRAGKQHAKLSLLVWSRHIRIIVASANLTEPGYRSNHEVAATVDLDPDRADADVFADAVTFLRRLVGLVPGAAGNPPEVQRAEAFLNRTERQARRWKQVPGRSKIRQHVVCTLPALGPGRSARSSLDEAVQSCRRRGASPNEVWVASPFFDAEDDTGRVTASLCKLMARSGRREVCFCVPSVRGDSGDAVPRLAAPKALVLIPRDYQGKVTVEILPDLDEDKNRRQWHAKMLAMIAPGYSALMAGSSNFTCAGMGVGQYRNAEANLLTIVDRELFGREIGQLEAIWPEMKQVRDPDSAEWLGADPITEEEEQGALPALPTGFLSATYRAGDKRQIVLRFDRSNLPSEWRILAIGQEEREILSASVWSEGGEAEVLEIDWEPIQPPEKVLVRWEKYEAWLTLNVEDSQKLPPPSKLEDMSADDMLRILAATDPGAAIRVWAKRQQPSDLFDPDLDSATPVDLDPLRRYDLQSTFLHRIRHRARILAQMRSNLERPVWGHQQLEWRLRGLVSVKSLADRLMRELARSDGARDESLLGLADFLIVLGEVEYRPSDGSLPKDEFDKVYRPFLGGLAGDLKRHVDSLAGELSEDTRIFWERVLGRCRV